jgi:hypothetical protein
LRGNINDKDIFLFGNCCNIYNINVASANVLLTEGFLEDTLKIFFFLKVLNLFQVINMLLNFLSVSLLLLPQCVNIISSNDDVDNNSLLAADENELELGCTVVFEGSHPGKCKFVELEPILHVNILIALLVDLISMDVLLIQSDFRLDRFALE